MSLSRSRRAFEGVGSACERNLSRSCKHLGDARSDLCGKASRLGQRIRLSEFLEKCLALTREIRPDVRFRLCDCGQFTLHLRAK